MGFTIWLAAATVQAAVILSPTVDGDIDDNGVNGYAIDSSDVRILTQSSGPDIRGIYEFDLASIPGGSTITGATLSLTLSGTLSNTGGNPVTVTFYGYTGNGTIEFTDFLEIASVVATETYPSDSGNRPPIGTTFSINLTDLTALQAASDSGTRYFGIVTDTHNFATYSIYSSEAAVAEGLKPSLTVNYVPEPGPGSLVCLRWPPWHCGGGAPKTRPPEVPGSRCGPCRAERFVLRSA
ncbi:MAG: DNRLRE domain-containing protein [Prosthecobacter sp.]